MTKKSIEKIDNGDEERKDCVMKKHEKAMNSRIRITNMNFQ
jgi:hypothetical protein